MNECLIVKESEREFGRQFKIEWDGVYVIIDGVRVTPEVLRMLFVEPNPDIWMKFERKEEQVLCTERHELAVAPI